MYGVNNNIHAGHTLDRELLDIALDKLHSSNHLFMDQFEVLGAAERLSGGQGTVQFARHVSSGATVAIKFYHNQTAFNVEEAAQARTELNKLHAVTVTENNSAVRLFLLPSCCVPIKSCLVLLRGL